MEHTLSGLNEKLNYALKLREGRDFLLFVSKAISVRNPITVFYWAYLLLTFAYSFSFLLLPRPAGTEERFVWLAVLAALLASLLVTTLIHAWLQYFIIRSNTTDQLRMRWSWKHLVFKLRFGVLQLNKRQFYLLNSLPFAMLSLSPLLLSFFLSYTWTIFFGFLAFFHACNSIKDFANMSYLFEGES